MTITHHASATDNEKVLALVLEAGAPLDEVAAHGLTPLAYSLSSCKPHTALLLLQKGADPRKQLMRVSVCVFFFLCHDIKKKKNKKKNKNKNKGMCVCLLFECIFSFL